MKVDKPADQIPTAWFVMLEIARQKGDTEGERNALRKLQELGVLVAFFEPVSPPNGPRKEGMS